MLQNWQPALAYLPMRSSAVLLLALFAITLPASGQTIDVRSGKKPSVSPSVSSTTSVAPAVNNSLTRPALLGTGPSALINRIDTQDLIKKGQKDAAIMFTCVVRANGDIPWSGTYRGTPGSKLLEQELQKRLVDTKFVPALYKGKPVDAIYYGTVLFAVVNGKPRLRIFSNQETEELKNENDFIGPQPFYGAPSAFTGLHYPSKTDAPVMVDAVVELKLTIDQNGDLQQISLVNEEPPFLGFADAAMTDFSHGKFIPAFRNGKPVACEITLPVFYKPKS
jgi:hypothetical protein